MSNGQLVSHQDRQLVTLQELEAQQHEASQDIESVTQAGIADADLERCREEGNVAITGIRVAEDRRASLSRKP